MFDFSLLIEISYFASAILFIVGLKRMSSPKTARKGIIWAGVGMAVATLATFLTPDMDNYALMLLAILVGGSAAFISGRKVAMTDMPQMIAIYNGMGGGAAGTIALIELLHFGHLGIVTATIAVIGAIIGSVSFSGSIIAFAKLQGLINKNYRLPKQNIINLGLFAAVIVLAIITALSWHESFSILLIFFILALVLGILVTLPIGGADMPVIISLYNAFTGLAVAFEGFVLQNAAMIIAGTVVGAAGTLLTQLMAKAMNRPLHSVLFSSFGEQTGEGEAVEGEMKALEPSDAGIQMAYAAKVIVIPGYGMAVAQAQHKLWEMCKLLINNGIEVKFAIHPVAGRMPGHMNVLLAEAGVPYDLIFDLDEINEEFHNCDVALVIGANDVVNPAARNNKSSPIYGMPILNADYAKQVLVIKRGKGRGFSGIENELFFLDNTRMVYGDGQKVAAELIQAIKSLD